MLIKKLVAVLACSLMAACSGILLADTRLHTDVYASPCQTQGKALIVLLPGRFDSPDDLVEHGFVDAVRRRAINADVALPNLHFGYYLRRTAVQRLHEDVILPALRQGYRSIWIGGISVGGLGALLHADHYPGSVNGLLLLAPYLGERKIHDEIRAAGGLQHWRAGTIDAADYERDLWYWIQTYGASGNPELAIYLGYGANDGFAPSNRLLAGALPRDHVLEVNGGHEWGPWSQLWEALLAKADLPHCA